MNEQTEIQLSGYRVTHDEADSFIFEWNDVVCGARCRPRDGKWVLVVHDVSHPDLDTAPTEEGIADTRSEAKAELCRLALTIVANRNH